MVQTVKDTIGLRIILDCDEDISSATVARIYYKKTPSSDTAYWSATIGTEDVTVDGSTYEANTYIYYDTIDNDLDTVSDWQLQAYIEMAGFTGYGSDLDRKPWANLRVKDHL